MYFGYLPKALQEIHIKVIGVEPVDSPTLFKALEANERVVLDDVGRFADGVAVKQIGELPFEIAKECVDDVILVSNDEMCAAIQDQQLSSILKIIILNILRLIGLIETMIFY